MFKIDLFELLEFMFFPMSIIFMFFAMIFIAWLIEPEIQEDLNKEFLLVTDEHKRKRELYKQEVRRVLESLEVGGKYGEFDCSKPLSVHDSFEEKTVVEDGKVYECRVWSQICEESKMEMENPFRFSRDFLDIDNEGVVRRHRVWRRERKEPVEDGGEKIEEEKMRGEKEGNSEWDLL